MRENRGSVGAASTLLPHGLPIRYGDLPAHRLFRKEHPWRQGPPSPAPSNSLSAGSKRLWTTSGECTGHPPRRLPQAPATLLLGVFPALPVGRAIRSPALRLLQSPSCHPGGAGGQAGACPPAFEPDKVAQRGVLRRLRRENTNPRCPHQKTHSLRHQHLVSC